MRHISLWAKNHVIQARVYIAILKVLLIALAIFTGNNLKEFGIEISYGVCLAFVGIFAIAVLFYPKHRSYVRQKSCDYAIIVATFAMLASIINRDQLFISAISATANTPSSVITNDPPSAEQILNSLKYRDKKSLTRQEKRILKRELKHQLKVYAKATFQGKKDEGSKALLIILAVIGALGLAYCVAALSCSLSCNGAEGAAVVVAILGTILVIGLLILVIRRIVRGPRRKRIDPDPGTQNG
jgi:hypothetical protein